jgi:hypothetical protein
MDNTNFDYTFFGQAIGYGVHFLVNIPNSKAVRLVSGAGAL